MVERGSTLQFTTQLPTQGAMAFIMEDKMFGILADMSSRLLSPEPSVSRKDTLKLKFSQPDERAKIARLLLEANVDMEPVDVGQVLDNAYYKRNCTTHTNDVELERQVRKFIHVGGIAMLQDEFPKECALIQAFGDIKGLFV